MCKQCYGITDDYQRCDIKHWTKYTSNGKYYCRHHLDDPSEERKREVYNEKQQRLYNLIRLDIAKKERIKEQENNDKKIKMRNEINAELESELRNKITLELRGNTNLG